MRIIKIMGCVLLGTLISVIPGQAQTLQNGSFESPTQGPPLYQTTYSTATGFNIPGWSVSEGFVDIVNPSQSAPFIQNGVTGSALVGNQALNLASGTGRSTIRQGYVVTNNDVVTLSFALGTAKTINGSGDATVDVVFGGVTTKFRINSPSASIGWIRQSLTNPITGSSGLSVLEFRSEDSPLDHVVLIDDVRIDVLPGGLTNSTFTNLTITNQFPISIPVPRLPGQVDTNYDAGGGLANVGVSPVVVSHSHLLSDDRLLIGGSFASYRGVSTPNFARINSDGTLDTTFFHGFGGASRVNDFVVQSDDRIVVVGAFDAFHEITYRRVARLLKDGQPDRSFRPGNGADASVNAVALDSAGRIYLGGEFQTIDATNRVRIARLLSNGKLDLSFDPGAGFNGPVNDVIALSNGKILVAGQFSQYNGFARNGLAQLNSDGSLDTTFDAPFETTANVKEIVMASSGRIVAGGEFNLVGSNGRRNIARFNADGTLDATFGSSTLNAGANASVNAIAACADGSLLVGGDFTMVDGFIRARIAKLGPDGLLDRSSQTVTTPQVVTNQVVSTNMVIVLTTNFAPSTNVVFGFVSNATFIFLSTNTPPTPAQTTFFTTNPVVATNQLVLLDIPNVQTFGINGGANGSVTDIILDSSDRAYVGGSFTNMDSVSARGLIRLQSCNPSIASSGGLTTALQTGLLTGAIIDASTGAQIIGASISNSVASTLSTNGGGFAFNGLVIGTNDVVFSAPGYASLTNQFVLTNAQMSVQTTVGLSPTIIDTNTIRLVMSWGPQPFILDSHLNGPSIFGNPPFEIAWTNLGSLIGPPFAALDMDATAGFGPETITITNTFPGIYSYWIQDWSSFTAGLPTTFPQNGANVKVFTHEGQVLSLTPPTGTGHYWHVLQFNGTNKTWAVINQLSNAIPTISSNVVYSNLMGGGIIGPSIGAPGPPRIDTQPKDLYELVGADSMLSVDVSGSLPFAFQWYHNDLPIASATNASLAFTNMMIPDSGDYYLLVTNPLGRATSVVAQVAVMSQTAPFVFLQPQSVSVDVGGTASFEVMAGGARPLFYEWRRDGVVVPNAGGPLLSITNVQTANEGAYRITVANSFGNVFSREVNLIVATPPVITNFTFDPGSQVAAGTTLTISVAASGKGPFDYRWFFNGALIPTAVGSNITFQSVQFTNAGDYSVIVSNVLGSATNGSNTLTVESPPIITVEPQNQFQTIGRSTALGVTAIGTGILSYQWRKDGVVLAGETANQLNFADIQQTDVGFYSVVVSNAFGAVTSRLARVDVVLERALLPWVVGYGGTGIDVGESVAVDGNGNVFVCGKFAGTAQFGTNTLVSAGLDDVFVVRLDANGNTIWAKGIGGTGFDVAKDITTASNGDILVTGSFEGVVDFGGTSLTNVNAMSYGDIFVARFTGDGNLVWVRRDGDAFVTDIGNCVAVDAAQNVYLAGASTLSSFGGTTFANHGRILLAKYDSLGNRVWARKAGGGVAGVQDAGESVAVDSSGNVLLAGAFHGGAFTNDTVVLNSRGFADGFLSKYDANGALQWTRQIGGPRADIASGVATVGGNAVVVGEFSATNVVGGISLASAGGVLPDGFVINYDASGDVVWARRLGGNRVDGVRDVATDAAGSVYITGLFQGTATFGNHTSVSIANTIDVFAARLRNDGAFEFVQQAGGDDSSGEFGNGIAVDSAGNGVFTGSFRGTLVAGGATLISSGLDNVFVSRLVSPPALTINMSGGQLVFSWPSFWTGFGVQVNDQFLRSTNWQNISLSNSNLVGDRIFFTNMATTNIQFFRLLRP